MHTILAYILLALPVVAGTIRGRVSDPGGQAVPFARVSLRPSGRTVTADGLGEFNIDGLPTGEYEVTATADGFEPETRGGIRVGAGSDATADLTFRKLLSSYTQVSVIGDAPEAALREIPGSASFVRRRELEETRPVDANEVLRRQPGVNVREDSGPAGLRMNIGVRGLNPDRSRTLLVLEDGLPLALAPYGEPEMYYSPPIDRMIGVEILKGSGSIVYGPQTIGGVLNFITPEPPLRQQTTVDLTGGQYGFFSGQASHGGTKGRAGWY
ncbi:MAG TPA: carboxypeptidase regulatory-like domain-containing protein, partial [Bryobacteraceae bacterium]|nr:carboxypeptidase regulatory-like domain-containing protein [Bryobacteraceae bacterium]